MYITHIVSQGGARQTMVKVIIRNELQKDEDFKGACQTACKTSATVSNVTFEPEQ